MNTVKRIFMRLCLQHSFALSHLNNVHIQSDSLSRDTGTRSWPSMPFQLIIWIMWMCCLLLHSCHSLNRMRNGHCNNHFRNTKAQHIITEDTKCVDTSWDADVKSERANVNHTGKIVGCRSHVYFNMRVFVFRLCCARYILFICMVVMVMVAAFHRFYVCQIVVSVLLFRFSFQTICTVVIVNVESFEAIGICENDDNGYGPF